MRKAMTGLAAVALVAGVAVIAVSLSQAPSAIAQETEDQVFKPRLEEFFDELVEDEVITEAQRDKIAAAFEDRFVVFGRGHRATPHLETIAEVLVLEVDELAEQLRDGSTIADIAGAKTQDVIDALIADHNTRIDGAVDEGRLTEEEAEQVRKGLAEHVEAMVNGRRSTGGIPFGIHHFHKPRGFGGFGLGFGLERITDLLGLDVAELRDRLAQGSSLADIAAEQNVAIQDIVDVLLADLNEKLDDLVAGERLTKERADQIRDRLTGSIESMISGERPEFGGMHFEFDGPPGFPHFPGPGHGHGFPGPGGFFDHRGEGTGTSA